MRLALGIGCARFVLATPGEVLAQAAPQSFSLDYSAPSGCPTREAFIAALQARSTGARETRESPRAVLEVTLQGSQELARGTLTVKLSDGQESRREMSEATCAEIVESMTVIGAMIVDGAGLDDPPPPASVAAPGAAASQSTPRRTAFPQRESSAARPAQERPRPSRPTRTRLATSVGLGPQTGVAPSLVPRYFVGLGLVFEGARAAPSVELAASIAESGRELARYGDARFRLTALTLSVCPWRGALSTDLAIRPCALVDAGMLRGDGDNTFAEREQRMPWLGFGGAGRLEFGLSRAFRLELEAHATALAWSDRFVFEPDSVVHDVPRLAFGLRLGALLLVP